MISLQKRLARITHRHAENDQDPLLSILAGDTEESADGFGIISEASFSRFLRDIPHLFLDGATLVNEIDWIAGHIFAHHGTFSERERTSIKRAAKVMQNIAFSASISGATDLWVSRFVLDSYVTLNLLHLMADARFIDPPAFCKQHGLDEKFFRYDMHMLLSRGMLVRAGHSFAWNKTPQNEHILKHAFALADSRKQDMVPPIMAVLNGTSSREQTELVASFLQMNPQPSLVRGWQADWTHHEIAHRLVPLVLAMRSLGLTFVAKENVAIRDVAQKLPSTGERLLELAGAIDHGHCVTRYGARLFERAPGPYGIIHAYHPYMTQHAKILRGESPSSWVARGENVAASQDANRKTFQQANDSLDRFCRDTGFSFRVFIEHAVGQGEATRQRFSRDTGAELIYVGADLEDAAINEAEKQQTLGKLPAQMRFVRNADIGKPESLLSKLSELQIDANGSVMLVGNGFHEVRNQNNNSMIEVFRKYGDAGIVIIFTEESGLSDDDLLATGWNTYHAGFRYVHELSGQGLRPASDTDDRSERYSWKRCATLGGYQVLEDYTTRTRRIYPHPRENNYNPAISMNYFCVPEKWAAKLKI